MPIEFRCVQCGRLLRAGDGTAGRRVLCPGCGTFSTVLPPEASLQGAPPVQDDGGEPPVPPPPPPAAEPDSPFGPQPPFGPPPVDLDDADNPYLAPTQYGPAPAPPPYYGRTPQTDPKAVVSLVLGISGLLSMCCCGLLGLPIAIVGLIVGIISLKSHSRGVALAGVIINGIVLALTAVMAMVYLFAILFDLIN